MAQQRGGRVVAQPTVDAGEQMLARVRCKGVEVAGIEVLDLSLAGCMVSLGVWLPREDQRVMISLPGMTNLPGQVLWVENGRAGLLFEQLLNEVVYEHLKKSYALGPRD